MLNDTFEVGSLSDEDLKEFQTPSLEDTSTLEKEKPVEVKEEVKKEEKKEETPKNPLFDNKEPGNLDDSHLEETKEEEEDPKLPKSKKEEIALDFNAVYQNYVKKGTWVPVTDEDGKEVEINDEETFTRLMDWQVQNAADRTLKERESEFGEQYESLVKHLAAGGKVEDLANTYQQEKEIDDIDSNDIDGAEQIVEAYYESLGWDKSEIKEQVETLKDKGEDSFKAFAEKRKTELKKSISADREQIIAQQEVQAKRVKDYQETYNKELKKAIHSQDIPDREKKDLEKFYYDLKNPVQGGKASDFYLKFEEIKQSPDKWMKLVQMVKDFDKFEKKTTTEREVKTKLFKLVREGEATSKKDSQTPEAVKQDQKKGAPTLFKQMYNKV